LHPAFAKFGCRLCYESYWITASGYGSDFHNCTIAIAVTQLWCFHPNNIENCPITQLLRQLHPAFAKFGCGLCWVA
jgi:hypothetical protein